MTTPDTIRREITIDASPEEVWRLVATPGWWVNDGEIIEHESSTEGDVTTLHWKGSDFPIRTLAVEEGKSVSYQWGSGRNDQPDSERTRIDMTIEQTGAGVRVVVVESGFAAYAAEQGQTIYDDNSTGWEQELAAAKALLEQ